MISFFLSHIDTSNGVRYNSSRLKGTTEIIENHNILLSFSIFIDDDIYSFIWFFHNTITIECTQL